MEPRISDRVKDALVDVTYPATKDDIVAAAAQHGADEGTLRALKAMPPVDYRNDDEVLSSVDFHPSDQGWQSASDKAQQHREQSHSRIAEHMKDTKGSVL